MAAATTAQIASLQAQINTQAQQIKRLLTAVSTLQGQLSRVKKG